MCISSSYGQYRIFQLKVRSVYNGEFSHFVNSHFVNSHFVNIDDQMGIDKVGIDKVGRYQTSYISSIA